MLSIIAMFVIVSSIMLGAYLACEMAASMIDTNLEKGGSGVEKKIFLSLQELHKRVDDLQGSIEDKSEDLD
jgi:hypothetical protein